MKRILCFGDSNTWGYSPLGERFDETIRWPRLLPSRLGEGYDIVEEGFCGRTTVHDDPTEGGYKSGINYLPPCLMSHNPLDLVIIMLGTNDSKERFNMNAYGVAHGIECLIKQVLAYGETMAKTAPQVLVVAPPPVGENILDTTMGPIFGAHSLECSRGYAEEYKKIAQLMDVHFFNAADAVSSSRQDAIHFTREGHLSLAEAMAIQIQNILGKA